MRVQAVLAIGDNENEEINKQIVDFIRKFGEISLQMIISESPLLIDLRAIGQKVPFNQSRHDSLDGFIKAGDECLVILPPIVKLQKSEKSLAEPVKGSNKSFEFGPTSIIGDCGHLEPRDVSEKSSSAPIFELVHKMNVLPLNYEFN